MFREMGWGQRKKKKIEDRKGSLTAERKREKLGMPVQSRNGRG